MILFNCYSIIKNECDSRCQGCSYCPICDDFHNGSNEKITRYRMFKYWLTIVWDFIDIHKTYKLRKAAREFWESKEGREHLEKLKEAMENRKREL